MFRELRYRAKRFPAGIFYSTIVQVDGNECVQIWKIAGPIRNYQEIHFDQKVMAREHYLKILREC